MKYSYAFRLGTRVLQVIIAVGLLYSMNSCLKTVKYTDKAVALQFSADTLRFDTVFTEKGTATRSIKVYNTSEEAVRTDVALARETPFFNLNVDGISGDRVDGVEILPGDSIYVFAEAEIDPNNPVSVSPFIVEDYIEFNTNGREQSVLLEAYGQNAIYLTPDSLQGKQVYLSCDFGTITLDNELPYVLNGVLVVDSCTLEITEGTELYIHGGITNNEETTYNDGILIFRKYGKLNIDGSAENPVLLNGDRIEDEFDRVSGQWNGIRFIEGSTGNKINYCAIKNASIGVFVDSLSELKIKNSKIINSSAINLLASTGTVYAENSLFADAGDFSVQLTAGGDYNFVYTTIANHGTGSPALLCANQYQIDLNNYGRVPIDFTMKNSIVSASNYDALSLSMYEGKYKNVSLEFEHTGIADLKITEEDRFPDFYSHFPTVFSINRSDNLFRNTVEGNYQLDTLSIAEEKAIPLPSVKKDILNRIRDATHPDAGCYEYLL